MRKFLSAVTIRQWSIIGILNLAIVASFGLLMRLKVIIALPMLDQKYIMHGHSHFAFSGWLSHMLMLLMIMVVLDIKATDRLPHRYQLLIGGNLLVSYGMLFSFALQGYGVYSIILSTLSVVLSYVFIGMMWDSLAQSRVIPLVKNWFKAALLFLFISSLGTYYLAFLQITHNVDTRKQLAAVYFFLHFQYNGWFFFSCMGLLNAWLATRHLVIRGGVQLFRVFVLACIPTYLLSVLWMKLPLWLYISVVIAVLSVNVSWFYWLISIYRTAKDRMKEVPGWVSWIMVLVSLAASIKFLLQGFSVIPGLSTLAYSFRPIVVGYLHLVLLAVISLFIIIYIVKVGIVDSQRPIKWSIWLFVIGIIGNELLLMLQGLGGILGLYIPYIPIALTLVALLMFSSLLAFFIFAKRNVAKLSI